MPIVCNLNRFDPTNPRHPLYRHIQGMIDKNTGLSSKELFAAIQGSLKCCRKNLLLRESEKAGYAPDEYLRCCIRWFKLWNSIGANNGFGNKTGGND